MRRTRRALLSGCAAGLVGLAGCAGGGPSEVAVGESAGTGGREVTVRAVTVQDSVYERAPDGTLRVRSPSRRQYVFADVAVDGGEIDPSNLALVGDDRRVEGFTDYRLRPDGVIDGDWGAGVYDDREGAGWVGFRVPGRWVGEAPRLRLEPGGRAVEWTLPAETVERLRAAPPTFSLSGYDLSAFDLEAPFEATIEVDNGGRGPGRFRFAVTYPLGGTGPPDTGQVSVPAGEQRAGSPRLDCHVGGEEAGFFRLQYPNDDLNLRPGDGD